MWSPAATGLGPRPDVFKKKCPYKEKFGACMERLDQARAQLQVCDQDREVTSAATAAAADIEADATHIP
jgi:hypothetical protein